MANILVVCTANQCRSPLAAGLLRQALERAGREHQVLSAGIIEGGEPSPAELVEVGRRHGIDLSGHLSRQLSPALLGEADLVLGMTRHHVRDLSVMLPAAWPRAFTLREANRRADQLELERMPVDRLVATIGEGRTTADLLAASRDDDIADPMGQGPAAFAELGESLLAEVERLVERI